MHVGCALCVKSQEGGLSSEHITITLSITAPPIRYFPSSSGTGRIGPVANAVPRQLRAHITAQVGRKVHKTYPTSESWLLDNRTNFSPWDNVQAKHKHISENQKEGILLQISRWRAMYQANNCDVSGDKINYGFRTANSSKSFRANSSTDTLNNNTESVLHHKLWIFFSQRAITAYRSSDLTCNNTHVMSTPLWKNYLLRTGSAPTRTAGN